MSARKRIRIAVNGEQVEREVDARTLLSDFLREELNLTGTHVGCEHGVCGACTLLVDGDSARSCLTLAVQVNGSEITTVEGLGTPDEMNLIQRKFHEFHGLQCGFCTPGMLATCMDILDKYPDATEAQMRKLLSGNLCRCTGYQHILDALLAAARERATDARHPEARS